MQLLSAYFFLYGPPTLLAAIPGIVALFAHRPRIGFLQIFAAVVVVVPLSIYLDRLETAELIANGHIADSLFFILRPWVHAIPYGLLSAALMALASLFLPDAPGRVRAEESSVRLAPWLEKMRRDREQ